MNKQQIIELNDSTQVSLDTSGATPVAELGPLNDSEGKALEVRPHFRRQLLYYSAILLFSKALAAKTGGGAG